MFYWIDLLESWEILEEPPTDGQESHPEAAPMQTDEVDEPRRVQGGIPGIAGLIPEYIKKALMAEHDGDMDRMVVEFGKLSKWAFCEDFIADTLGNFQDYVDAMFRYLPWLARKAGEQKVKIVALKTRIEDMANSADYDHLLKEKSSWSDTRKQLEEELLEAKQATNQAIQERNEAHATTAKQVEVADKHLQSLIKLGVELSTLCINEDQLRHDNSYLSIEVQRLTLEVTDLSTQLGEATIERDKALQDT
ncbi:unnamed protein product [Calypogeia fissa]